MAANSLATERQLAEFLPAVLEVQASPPSPIARLLIWSIILLFVAAVLWACYGRVDIVASARGQLVPAGHVKVMQSKVYGTVMRLNVEDGDVVAQGDILIELDATLTIADERRILRAVSYARSEESRLQDVLRRIDRGGAKVAELRESDERPTQERLRSGQIHEYATRLKVVDGAISRQKFSRAAAQNNITRQAEILPLVRERAESLRTLVDRRLQGRAAWLDAEQERIEQTRILASEQFRLSEIEQELARLAAERSTLAIEFRNGLLQQLAEKEKIVQGLEQELVKAREQIAWQTIRAPAAGTIQELAVHTVGGVVQPAQTLLTIVPADAELRVDALLLNKDIGFVSPGQEAEIKVDTFPFTRYGTLEAVVERVTDDAVEHEWYGQTYETRLRLADPTMHVEGTPVALRPGMGVTVEIKTGRRRVIEFLLDPLLRFQSESLRER